ADQANRRRLKFGSLALPSTRGRRSRCDGVRCLTRKVSDTLRESDTFANAQPHHATSRCLTRKVSDTLRGSDTFADAQPHHATSRCLTPKVSDTLRESGTFANAQPRPAASRCLTRKVSDTLLCLSGYGGAGLLAQVLVRLGVDARYAPFHRLPVVRKRHAADFQQGRVLGNAQPAGVGGVGRAYAEPLIGGDDRHAEKVL